MKNYGLLGKNIGYSFSPLIYNYWFKKYNISDSTYELIDSDNLLPINSNYIGLNLTKPFKEDILKISNITYDKDVSLIGSANTLVYNKKTNQYTAYNTDYKGLLDSYNYFNINLSGKNILVLGCKGAGRAVIYSAILENANDIYIWNRTKSVEDTIINDFYNIKFLKKYLDDNIKDIDIIFNATSIAFDNIIKLLNIDLTNKTSYDLNYYYDNDIKPTINGIMMLLFQASRNFNIWFNIMPNIDNNLIALVKK